MHPAILDNYKMKYTEIESGIRSELYCRHCNKQMLSISPFELKHTAANNMLQLIDEYQQSLLIHVLECEKYQEKIK